MPNQQLQDLYQDLQRSSNAGDIAGVGQKLGGIKLALAKQNLLIPNRAADEEDLMIARSTLELAAFHSLRVKDVKSFERYEAILGGFYRDLSSILPPSPHRPTLLSLSLLLLLSQGKISAFHTLLETIEVEMLAEDDFVRWVIDLERWLMEGSYSRVWRARERVPREEFGVLLDGLVGTIRNEIASCHEKAYSSLPLGDATRLLFFSNQSDTVTFGQGRGWKFSPESKTFTYPSGQSKSSFVEGALLDSGLGVDNSLIPLEKDAIIKSALGYAVELEAIV